MKEWRFKRGMVAAALVYVLAGSTARAEQGAPPGELEALKRMVQEVMSQNEELRRRVRDLEAAMTRRGQAPEEAAKQAEAPKEPAKPIATEPAKEPIKAGKSSWGKIQLGGAIEVEVGSRRDFRGVRSSDLTLNTAEFDFEADVVDWGKAELSLQWDSAADKITVNEAMVTLAKPAVVPVYLKTGRGVMPFGISTGSTVAARLAESVTITGPLTLEVFETKEDHVLLGVKGYGFTVGAYVYDGTTNNVVRGGKRLEHYGATLGYGLKTELLSFDAGVGWIDSVFDTDALTTAFPELVTRPRRAYVPGVATYARLGLWGVSLVGEYDAANRETSFKRTLNRNLRTLRTQPEAWQIELGYTTRIFGDIRPFGAFSYSETSSMFAAFPKTRRLITVGSWLSEDVRVAVEYSNEHDYGKGSLGTGRESDAGILRLTYEW